MAKKNGEPAQQNNKEIGHWNWYKNNYGYEVGKWAEVEQAAAYNPEVKAVLDSIKSKVSENANKPPARSEEEAWDDNESGASGSANIRNLHLRLFMAVKRANAEHGNGYNHEMFTPYVQRNPKKYQKYFPTIAQGAQRQQTGAPKPPGQGPSAVDNIHDPNRTVAWTSNTANNEQKLMDLITQLQQRVADLEKKVNQPAELEKNINQPAA